MIKVSKNVVDYIRQYKVIRLLSLIHCDEKYNFEKMSDFELFDLFEASLHLISNTEVYRNYLDELKKVGLMPPDLVFYSRESSCKRWRMLFFSEEHGGAYEGSITEHRRLPPKRRLPTDIFDIEKFVTENIKSVNDITELARLLSSKLCEEENTVKTMALSIEQLEYLRPEPYAAALVFNKIKCDEICNNKERFAFFSSLLFCLLKVQNSVSLYLFGRGDAVKLALVSYLCERTELCGKIYVDIFADSDIEAYADIGAKYRTRFSLVPVAAEALPKDFYGIYPEICFAEGL